jgi:hypothetical protein
VSRHYNMPVEIAKYFFGSEVDYISVRKEYNEFWSSLTEQEKDYYRTLDLKTGLVCEGKNLCERHRPKR